MQESLGRETCHAVCYSRYQRVDFSDDSRQLIRHLRLLNPGLLWIKTRAADRQLAEASKL